MPIAYSSSAFVCGGPTHLLRACVKKSLEEPAKNQNSAAKGVTSCEQFDVRSNEGYSTIHQQSTYAARNNASATTPATCEEGKTFNCPNTKPPNARVHDHFNGTP